MWDAVAVISTWATDCSPAGAATLREPRLRNLWQTRVTCLRPTPISNCVKMQTRSRSPSGYPDTTAINLSRLLSRLEQILLFPEASQALRKSSFERARVSAVRCQSFLALSYSLTSGFITECRIRSNVTPQSGTLRSCHGTILQINEDGLAIRSATETGAHQAA
jgi:hypothetical protein